MKTNRVFAKNIEAFLEGKRYIINKGGTRSGKTYAILQLLYLIATKDEGVITVVSESYPHLKRGALRDFKDILISDGVFDYEKFTASPPHTYKVTEKCLIEFVSLDNPGKAHGASRKHLFINEAQNMDWETARQLIQRTSGTIFIDYNPTHSFWADEILSIRDNAIVIHSTYKDNDFLSQNIIAEIESYKDDEQWWRVYGLGLTGTREGLVYKDVAICSESPADKDYCYGLDFGFSNDPTVLLKIVKSGGELYVDEIIYQRGLTNDDIADKMRSAGVKGIIYADAAEPKSIEELRRRGFDVRPGVKGEINAGIDFVRRHRINITSRSLETIKDFRNYIYDTSSLGGLLNKPKKAFDHAPDALRYAVMSHWFEVRKAPRAIVNKLW